MLKPKYPCPVCGYQMDHPATDFNICPSCGVEFGYSDAGRSYDDLRGIWIHTGLQWSSRVVRKPKDWSPYRQMMRAGIISVGFTADARNSEVLATGHVVRLVSRSAALPEIGYALRAGV